MNNRFSGAGVRSIFFRFALCATVIGSVFLGVRYFHQPAEASLPAAGTLNPVIGNMVTWMGDRTVLTSPEGETTCSSGDSNAVNCDAFALTVGGVPSDWVGKRITITIRAGLVSDYDLVVRKETNGLAGMQGNGLTNSTPPLDNVLTSSGNSPGQPESVVLSPATNGVGVYYPRSIYFAAVPGDQYRGTAIVEDGSMVPPASACALPVPTYDNYQPPVNNPATNGTTAYPRRNSAGEPSIGVNWNTGNVMTMHRLVASRTTFDDSTSPPDPAENTGHKWFSRAMPTVITGLDPIGFTDSVTGHSLFGELNGNFTNGIVSDDDFATFTPLPTQGITPSSSVDHQTIGGGIPKPGIPGRQPTTSYPHLVYYASQNIGYASAATSLDGGITYLPATVMYNATQCTGIHGHAKVAPDGTVFVPNKGCQGQTGIVVSEDNGLNWAVRRIPTSTSGKTDPSVGIGAGGRLYVGYSAGDNHAHVVVSDDKGLTWRNDFDLSAAVSPTIRAIAFPQVVAGDNDRAAIFFLGSTSNDPNDPLGTDNEAAGPNFAGTWFPYIATTCDGGRSWSVVKADNDPLFPGVPNPVQQGVICTSGTTCPGGPPNTRNLLDFNGMVVDSRGRTLAVYADGCNTGHPCMNITDNSGTRVENQGIARMTIIRQRGGMRLFSAFDPGGPAPPSLSPPVSVEQEKSANNVKWSEPDDGGSPLTSYRIYRGTNGGTEQMIAEVKPGVYAYRDTVKKRFRSNYSYRVTAVNNYGESPRGQ